MNSRYSTASASTELPYRTVAARPPDGSAGRAAERWAGDGELVELTA
ncbi:hypothetical protein IU422_11980 [Nocardia farcinica]|nr:hypothetical protein [Nocardia farcinica]